MISNDVLCTQINQKTKQSLNVKKMLAITNSSHHDFLFPFLSALVEIKIVIFRNVLNDTIFVQLFADYKHGNKKGNTLNKMYGQWPAPVYGHSAMFVPNL